MAAAWGAVAIRAAAASRSATRRTTSKLPRKGPTWGSAAAIRRQSRRCAPERPCSKRVGHTGRVIGVDMTPEMVTKARGNARRVGASNVEFRLGEIEHLPVADGTVDAIISNCVINLSPDKAAVFREAFRVLKPGGRLAISDVVATRPMPRELAESVEALTGCVAGSATADELRALLSEAGFEAVDIEPRRESACRACETKSASGAGCIGWPRAPSRTERVRAPAASALPATSRWRSRRATTATIWQVSSRRAWRSSSLACRLRTARRSR